MGGPTDRFGAGPADAPTGRWGGDVAGEKVGRDAGGKARDLWGFFKEMIGAPEAEWARETAAPPTS